MRTKYNQKHCPRKIKYTSIQPNIQTKNKKNPPYSGYKYENATKRESRQCCYGCCFCNVVSLFRFYVLLCLEANNVCLVQKQMKLVAYRCATVKSKQNSKEYQLLHSSCFVQQTTFPFGFFFSVLLSFCVYGRVFSSHIYAYYIHSYLDSKSHTDTFFYIIIFLWTNCVCLHVDMKSID